MPKLMTKSHRSIDFSSIDREREAYADGAVIKGFVLGSTAFLIDAFSHADRPASDHSAQSTKSGSRSRYDLRALFSRGRPCFPESHRWNPADRDAGMLERCRTGCKKCE